MQITEQNRQLAGTELMNLMKDYGYRCKADMLPGELQEDLRKLIIDGYSCRDIETALYKKLDMYTQQYPDIYFNTEIPSYSAINNYRKRFLAQNPEIIINETPYFIRKLDDIYQQADFDAFAALISLYKEAERRYELGKEYEERTRMPLRERRKELMALVELNIQILNIEFKLGLRKLHCNCKCVNR